MLTLSELANYAILQPEIYAWNFYTGPDAVREYMDTHNPHDDKEAKKIMNIVYGALFGALTWLFSQNVLTTIQYLALVNRMEHSSCSDIAEMYRTATALLSIGTEADINKVKKNIVAGVKNTLGRKAAFVIKRAIKNKNENEIYDIIDKLKKDAAQVFADNFIDSEKEYRFHKPECYDKAFEILGERLSKLAVCIIGTPEASMFFYDDKTRRRKERVDKLSEMGAPEIVMRNEWRMYRENYVPYLLSKGILEGKIDDKYVTCAIGKFYELESEAYKSDNYDSAEVSQFVADVEKVVTA